MPPPSETAALLVLLRTSGRPWQQYADLLEEAGSATALLDRQELGDDVRLFDPDRQQSGETEAVESSRDELLNSAQAAIDQWGEQGIHVLSVLDAGYPENLRTVHDRPPLIWVAGRLEPRDTRSIAVVGTRRADWRATAAARGIASHLAECGYTVVSGLAAGIDSAAHTAALASGGRTVAVIGTGLRRVYPPGNAPLQRRIADQGAVVSQFWPDSPPSRRSFPMRNAVMSGLTLGTVVVEASHTSGARLQARLALAHGRPVLLPRPLLAHSWARDFAQRPGAYVVGSPAEIVAIVERLTAADALVP